MTTSPAGWHPDPTGRHQLRYWDGLRWTGHVSDVGAVGVDPPAAEPTPERAPRTVYVDAHLRVGFRQQRLFADEHALWWGDDCYSYPDVTAVTWWATRVVAGPAHNLEYRIRLWQGKVVKTITFTGRDDHVRAAYDGAVDVVMRNVGTRLVADVLRTIEDGGRAAVAGVVLSQSGAEFGKKHLDWSTPFRLASYSSQGTAWVSVKVDMGNKEKPVGDYAVFVQNGTLLPFLLETLAARYGRRDGG